jgi:pimeloyl-ACP methyl ester carboxylesterase
MNSWKFMKTKKVDFSIQPGSLKALVIFFLFFGYGIFFCQAQENFQIDSLVPKLGRGFVCGSVNVNGTTLYYVRGGMGPALVLIHGFPEDWYEWHKIIPDLAKHFTVVAVDLRGVGGSTAAPAGYDAANMAEDIHQLILYLKLENVYIVGHDIGGMVTYAFVRLYPKTTRGVMILDVGLPGMGRWKEDKANPFLWHFGFHQTPKLPEDLIAGRQFIYFREGMFDRFALNPGAITDSDVAHYVNSYASPEQLKAGLGFYRAFPADEKFNTVHRGMLGVPIVLAGGDHSVGPNLPEIAESLRISGCTNVITEVIKNSGHYVVEEQPQSVAELIGRYAL